MDKKNHDKDSIEFNSFFRLFLSGMIFGIGYLMLIVNGYYHFKSDEFIQIGRQDLIARLGFLSYANGMMLYPTSLIIVGLIILITNKEKKNRILKKIIYSIFGLFIPAIPFYGHFELQLLFDKKEKWIVGIILIGISILIIQSRKNKYFQPS